MAATLTPWGRADKLRTRKLRPGPQTSRETAARNQRERLFGAMVAVVAERGYEATRVADLLEVSGVSRSGFYKHFDDKLDCFLATMDAIATGAGERVAHVFGPSRGSWREDLEALLETVVGLIVEQPAAARLYYVESYAAGVEAIERVDRMGERLEQLAKGLLEKSPQHAGMPQEMLRAILRGFRRIVQTRLRGGRDQELVDIAPDLLRWALDYRTPPKRLKRPRKPPVRFQAPRPGPQSPRSRLLMAVVELMAEKGYAGTTITDIAQRASASLTTFYDNFDGKQEAIAAALELSAQRLLAVTAPAYREAPDWPHAVGAAMHGLFGCLTLEQSMAHFGGMAVHTSSPLVTKFHDQLLQAAHAYLAEGYRQHPDTNPLAAEGIGTSIDSLLFDQLRLKGCERLYEVAPTATYLALAPFIGADEACEVANESHRLVTATKAQAVAAL